MLAFDALILKAGAFPQRACGPLIEELLKTLRPCVMIQSVFQHAFKLYIFLQLSATLVFVCREVYGILFAVFHSCLVAFLDSFLILVHISYSFYPLPKDLLRSSCAWVFSPPLSSTDCSITSVELPATEFHLEDCVSYRSQKSRFLACRLGYYSNSVIAL